MQTQLELTGSSPCSQTLSYISSLNLASPIPSRSPCSPWLVSSTSAVVTTVLVMRTPDFTSLPQTTLWPYKLLSTSLVELASLTSQGCRNLNRSIALPFIKINPVSLPQASCSSCSAGSGHKTILYFTFQVSPTDIQVLLKEIDKSITIF